ncbi:ATP-binding protein [Effusibacillus lacus]|uniref:Serine/threonine protein kinase n=1 Tax=Effusibacillus lacus TaxID=1348429 RepID=A0A292YQ86_9BACL|nr:ATP-binding protein [Effusibacillus lacus]TCS70652.1 serine/threonine-protein kinase RsbW [Effusibacillus lacus]GAX90650.1 serine/threonine protein kinase [Effusibacillus lacus]
MKKSIVAFTFNDYEGFQQVRSFVGEYIKQTLSDGNSLIVVAVNEAVNNAFKHGVAGNGGSVTLKLEVFHGKRLIVRVKDPGPGFPVKEALLKLNNFRRAALEDYLSDSDLLKESDRGLFIMKCAADAIRFNAKGNQVLLVKKITTTAGDTCGFAQNAASEKS